MSPPTHLLLNKGVVRNFLRGLHNLARGERLIVEQDTALRLFNRFPAEVLLASNKALNLAKSFAPPELFEVFRQHVSPFLPTRYQRRWARRLRQHFGFSREDAYQIALCTFGRNLEDTLFGTASLVTFDLRLIERFHHHQATIQQRLQKMIVQLQLPYRRALLPETLTPQAVLSRFLTP